MGLLSFYSGQWEEYHTGTLDHVTAELIMISIHFISAFKGPVFWDSLITIPVVNISVTFRALMLYGSTFSVLYAVYGNVVKICKMTKEGKVCQNEAILRIAPFLICSALFTFWSVISNVLVDHPHLFFCSWGFLFSNLIGRMVLCRVCEEEFKPDFTLLGPVVFGLINSVVSQGGLIPETLYLWGLFLWSAVMFVVFSHWVVDSITTRWVLHS